MFILRNFGNFPRKIVTRFCFMLKTFRLCSFWVALWTYAGPFNYILYGFYVFSWPYCLYMLQFSSAQSLSRVQLFATPWIAAHQASLSITNSRSSLRSRPSSQWCHPAILSSVVPFSSCPQLLPASESFPMSQLFAWGGQSTGVSASALPSKEIPGLISFRMDWLDLLAVQGTLKSLLQHHSSKASILQCSAAITKVIVYYSFLFNYI